MKEMGFRNHAICYLAFFMLACWPLASCDSRRVYEDNTEFPDRTWKITEEPRFEFNIADTSARYNLYYNVRNSLTYPYARIFVIYHLYDSTGTEITKQLVNYDLFDQKTGSPIGSSGLGDLYDHQFLLLQRFGFPAKGNYVVKLDQQMRKDTLQGVVAVGIRVEKEEEN